MLVDLWGGGDAGWKKVGELFANMKVLNRSSLVFQGVGNGEYPLGISLEYAGYLWAAGGAPVKVIYPADGTLAAMEGVAIVKGGPNPEPAKAFVDYINRKAVREMILKATFRRPTRRTSTSPSCPATCRRCRRSSCSSTTRKAGPRSAPRRSRRSRTSSRIAVMTSTLPRLQGRAR